MPKTVKKMYKVENNETENIGFINSSKLLLSVMKSGKNREIMNKILNATNVENMIFRALGKSSKLCQNLRQI
jgi:hypothetical protein